MFLPSCLPLQLELRQNQFGIGGQNGVGNAGMLQLVFRLLKVLLELHSHIFRNRVAFFGVEAVVQPAAGLLRVVVERLEVETFQMGLWLKMSVSG